MTTLKYPCFWSMVYRKSFIIQGKLEYRKPEEITVFINGERVPLTFKNLRAAKQFCGRFISKAYGTEALRDSRFK